MKTWIVRYYDKRDRLIESFLIKDRTEDEAEIEAMALMPTNCEDWTLMPHVVKSEAECNLLTT